MEDDFYVSLYVVQDKLEVGLIIVDSTGKHIPK